MSTTRADYGEVAVKPQNGGPSSIASTPLHFCCVCGKPFDSESSHARHVQYCRQQAHKRRRPRPKACLSCSQAKSKCDFKWPCSRCHERQILCSYDKRQSVIIETPIHQIRQVTSKSNVEDQPLPVDVPLASATPHISRVLNQDEGVQPSAPTSITSSKNMRDSKVVNNDSLDRGFFGELSGDQYAVLFSSSQSATIDVDLALRTNVNIEPRTLQYSSNDSKQIASTMAIDSCDDLYPGLHDATSSRKRNSGGFVSHGCRQFIASFIRTYPRMMLHPDTLPPFIHPLACGLYYDTRDIPQVGPRSSVAFLPLKKVQACIGITRTFNSMTDKADESLWHAIDHEHKAIQHEAASYSKGEILVAIQVMVIYTIIRLIESGRDYFLEKREMLRTMKNLSEAFAELCPGSFSPTHKYSSRPSWEDWILDETRRRIAIVCSLMSLLVGSDACNIVTQPHLIHLPSNRALWEARSTWAWETGYDAFQRQHMDKEPFLDTVGDLAILKHTSVGSTLSIADKRANLDIIDDWHTGLDGLGMLLAAVIADA